MTNETTASQPTDFRKVLVAVRESLQFANDSPNGGINDTIWMMHGPLPETVFDFIDAALEVETQGREETPDLFASQPKSIGDDTQFQAMTEFMLRSEYDVLIKLIDSFFRAPAAQASATIQAAPDERVEFEKWFSAENFGGYKESMWAAWNRRAQLSINNMPISMVLFCPKCGKQHIDAPDERSSGWNNPPHRSHLCHACGCIWRPADVPTNGVKSINTEGKADATIQAAPTDADKALDRPWQTNGHGHYEYIETICDAYESGIGDGLVGKTLMNPYNGHDNPDQNAAFEAGHIIGVERAATIQEPVMVAEQVLVKCEECDGKGGTVTAEWVDPISGPECEGDACGVCGGSGVTDELPLFPAAPMVADPAGVNALIDSIESGLGEIVTASHSGLSGTAANVRYVAEELEKEIDAYREAATVKAVPSEALEYLGTDGKYLDTQGWSVENYDIGDTVTVPIHRNGKVIALVVAEYSENFREVIGENCRLLTGAAALASAQTGGVKP